MWGSARRAFRRAESSLIRSSVANGAPRPLYRSFFSHGAGEHSSRSSMLGRLFGLSSRQRTGYDHSPVIGSITTRRSFAMARVRTKRQKTPRTPRKPGKPLKTRRLMPAKSIYSKPFKPVTKESFSEQQHEEFQEIMTRAESRQFAWKDGSDSSPSIRGPIGLRRAATSWNGFDSKPTITKARRRADRLPIQMVKKRRRISVSTVVSFNGTKDAGRIKSGRHQRKLIAGASSSSARGRIVGRMRRIPPSDKRSE